MKKVHTSIRLKQLMDERNLKQVDVLRITKPICEKYGIRLGKNDLSQYVSGKTEPGQSKLFVLAKALKVNPVWLMGLNVPMENENQTCSFVEAKETYTAAENRLISNYRKLNTSGKEKASDYVEDLTTIDKYTTADEPKSKLG